MRFHILTLFPEMVLEGLGASVIGRAAGRQTIEIHAVNIRDYTQDKHGSVDDYPYGGGAGMLMQAQPVFDAYRAVAGEKKLRTIYMTPQGTPFTQKLAGELSRETELVFLCGHYEGIDERVLDEIVTDRVSIGDYVLTGGELPAMVMVDAISRLVPGVLGNEDSPEKETFHNDLLEYPQYSRPKEWHGREVPAVLLSGDHSKVEAWRLEQAKERTRMLRPDLFEKYIRRESLIDSLSRHKRDNIYLMESLSRGKGEILYGEGGSLLLYDWESGICLLHAEEEPAGEQMLSLLPGSCKVALTSHGFLSEMLCERLGFQIYQKCCQMCYTRREPLSVRHREDIRALTPEDFRYVLQCVGAGNSGCMPEHGGAGNSGCISNWPCYIERRIRAKALWGACVEGRPVGFAGVLESGAIGMLYVEEAFRGRGIGRALAAYGINREREAGHIPYAQFGEGDEAVLRLLEDLGLYRAKGNIWRLVRSS